MKVTPSLLILSLIALLPATAHAKTADGKPPSQETVCDPYDGKAFGLCNAYCEAMDCDSPSRRASETACMKKAEKFQELTGTPPPCGDSFCACLSDDLPVFETFVDGSRLVTACEFDGVTDTFIMTIDSGGSFAELIIVPDEDLAVCSTQVNTNPGAINESIFVSPEGAAGCVDLLLATVDQCPCDSDGSTSIPDCR